MSSKSPKPEKLCKRSYFMRSESAPKQSQMRHELGSDLANVILELMSPACKAWMGVDRKLAGPAVDFCVDSDQLKANVHEHILHVGTAAEERLERQRRKRQLAKMNDRTEEFELLKFEARQKIEIARDEERKRMAQQLVEAKLELAEKFRVMKMELGLDYLRGRREMARFMCKNLKKQAFEVIAKIAKQYRIELEHETAKRVRLEVGKLEDQIHEIVERAVQNQKDIDSEAMRRMCYRYEELLKNLHNREACRQLTELSQQICSRWEELTRRPENLAVSCQTSFIIPEPVEEEESLSDVKSECFEEPSEFLEADDIFVIETCLMTPGPSPVYSYAEITSNEEPLPSSSTIEAITMDGRVYAQPKYYQKIREQLFPVEELKWESETEQQPEEETQVELPSEGSDLAATEEPEDEETVEDTCDDEVQLECLNLDEPPGLEWFSLESVDSSISNLFDVQKSASEIELLVNGIVLKYIKATERDFEK